jgi:hypothetical protein
MTKHKIFLKILSYQKRKETTR